jgi:hypothetical protein
MPSSVSHFKFSGRAGSPSRPTSKSRRRQQPRLPLSQRGWAQIGEDWRNTLGVEYAF